MAVQPGASWVSPELVRSDSPHPCHGAPVVEGVYATGCWGIIRAGEAHLQYNPGGKIEAATHHCLACVNAFFDAGYQPRWDVINERRQA